MIMYLHRQTLYSVQNIHDMCITLLETYWINYYKIGPDLPSHYSICYTQPDHTVYNGVDVSTLQIYIHK